MKIEYEATFPGIGKEDARERLHKAGATLSRPEFLQKRIILDMPTGHEVPGGFVRVRDEGNRITLTFKIVGSENITDQRESQVTVDDFDTAVELLKGIGCTVRVYEETTRELWMLDGVEVTIDDWPHLGSMVEIEGRSENEVRKVSDKLGFDWGKVRFCTSGTLYKEKYGLGPRDLAQKTGKLVTVSFETKNPFL